MATWLRRNLCQRGQSTHQRRLFYLEGDPKALSSRARSTAQAPAPGHEHRHFVRVCINASKTTTISETGAQALRTQCIYSSFRNHSPLQNQGAKHCVCNAKKELDRGPLTTPKPLIAPPLAPPTPAKNGGPSETAVRSDTGGASCRDCTALAVI